MLLEHQLEAQKLPDIHRWLEITRGTVQPRAGYAQQQNEAELLDWLSYIRLNQSGQAYGRDRAGQATQGEAAMGGIVHAGQNCWAQCKAPGISQAAGLGWAGFPTPAATPVGGPRSPPPELLWTKLGRPRAPAGAKPRRSWGRGLPPCRGSDRFPCVVSGASFPRRVRRDPPQSHRLALGPRGHFRLAKVSPPSPHPASPARGLREAESPSPAGGAPGPGAAGLALLLLLLAPAVPELLAGAGAMGL